MNRRVGDGDSSIPIVTGAGNIETPQVHNESTTGEGLTVAVEHGQVKNSTTDRRPGIAEGGHPVVAAGHINARNAQPGTGIKLYAFNAQAAPKSIGFLEALNGLKAHPQFEPAIKGLVARFNEVSGLGLGPQVVQAALAKPELLADHLAISAHGMAGAFDAMYQDPTALGEPAQKTRRLPDTFDFDQLGKLGLKAPPRENLEQIAGPLFRGGVRPAGMTDQQVIHRQVLAETFDRLADNADVPEGERFKVRFGGGEYTRISGFLKALQDAGYTVEARTDHRSADFAYLKMKTPDGIKSIAAPLMVTHEIGGKQAVLPAVHSELVISIKAGPEVKGEPITGEIKWYQGVPNTGFFPSGIEESADWTGNNTTATFKGAEAAKAIEYAGLLGDVINTVAKDIGGPIMAYGKTGVCIDSVAVIKRLFDREITTFPMLQNDKELIAELERRAPLSGASVNRQDSPEYRALGLAIIQLPNDTSISPTFDMPQIGLLSQKERILSSIDLWQRGQEPLPVVLATREMLS